MVAWATLGSFGVLNGTTYVQVYGDRPGPDDSRQLLAGLLGAALSCIPVLLGLLATRRTSADDPSWVLPVARGAVLVASIAVVLRVVAALLAGSTSDAFFSYG